MRQAPRRPNEAQDTIDTLHAAPPKMNGEEAFFQLYEGLDRLGPGSDGDVARALRAVGPGPDPAFLDAGCGTGADISALLAARPARLLAVDPHAPFIDTVRRRFGPPVEARAIGMEEADGPFDFIWCAGALYFLGLEAGLATLRGKLTPCGAIAVSHPCHFVRQPSSDAIAFWEAEGMSVGDRAGLLSAVRHAGFDALDDWKVDDAGWSNFYGPLMDRVAALRDGADAALTEVLDAAEGECAAWREVRGETGYLMVVARAR